MSNNLNKKGSSATPPLGVGASSKIPCGVGGLWK